MSPQLIIFDMDGVLADTEPLHDLAHAQILREISGGVLETPNIHGTDAVEKYRQILRQLDSCPHTPQELAAMQFRRVLELLREQNPGHMPGLPRLLEALNRRQIPFAVASSSPRSFVEPVLDYLGVSRAGRVVVTGSDGHPLKPAPDLYLAVLRQTGLSPGVCLAVEDSGAGIRAAKAANLPCAALCPPGSNQDTAQADYRVASLDQLISLL